MFAALHIPRFALQAGLRFRPSEGREAEGEERSRKAGAVPGVPVALVDPGASKPVVLDVTRAAERFGVVAGLPVPQALGRCPELEVLHRSVQAEAAAKELLFCCAYSLSPRVESLESGLFLVDLSGVKGDAAETRCGEIISELTTVGLICRIGVADTSAMALLAAKRAKGVLVIGSSASSSSLSLSSSPSSSGAMNKQKEEEEESRNDAGEVAEETSEYGAAERAGSEKAREAVSMLPRGDFLASLPIGAAEPSERLTEILDKWGIRTVGAFAALRRSAVGARLGTEGLQLWDRVNGKEERVVAVVQLPGNFEESWEFEYEVDALEPLLFLLRRFLDQLCLRLKVAHKVASRARFELRVAYGDPVTRAVKVPEPTFDVEALFRLVAGRLETIESESPIVAFTLRIDAIAFKQRQLGLFESSLKNPHRFAQTLARVAGIVGADRVGCPVLDKEGAPDGVRMEELPAEVRPMETGVSLENHYGLAMRRLRPARPAAVELQGRQPVWFKSDELGGFVKACRGPWLHSGHWWESEGAWSRIEWDVELNKGGVYRLVRSEGEWFLEGVYD